jgi:hypothetical protein
MNLLAWNCRGLGQPRTVQELVRFVRMFSPKILFLSKIRQNKRVVEAICRRLGFENCLPMCGRGKGGGLALFWSKCVPVELINHIDVKISEPNGIKWRATFVYGESKIQDRHLMWELLRRIKPSTSEPWFMVGDFKRLCGKKSTYALIEEVSTRCNSLEMCSTIVI